MARIWSSQAPREVHMGGFRRVDHLIGRQESGQRRFTPEVFEPPKDAAIVEFLKRRDVQAEAPDAVAKVTAIEARINAISADVQDSVRRELQAPERLEAIIRALESENKEVALSTIEQGTELELRHADGRVAGEWETVVYPAGGREGYVGFVLRAAPLKDGSHATLRVVMSENRSVAQVYLEHNGRHRYLYGDEFRDAEEAAQLICADINDAQWQAYWRDARSSGGAVTKSEQPSGVTESI